MKQTIQEPIKVRRSFETEGNMSYCENLRAGSGVIATAVDASISTVIVFSFKMSTNNLCTITTCECGRVYTKNIGAVVTGDKRVEQAPTEKALRKVGEVIETFLAEKYSIGVSQFEVSC